MDSNELQFVGTHMCVVTVVGRGYSFQPLGRSKETALQVPLLHTPLQDYNRKCLSTFFGPFRTQHLIAPSQEQHIRKTQITTGNMIDSVIGAFELKVRKGTLGSHPQGCCSSICFCFSI